MSPVQVKFNKPTKEPAMAMIYVRTKPDRRAFYEGKIIPQDKFVPVPDTPYIRRLIDHWEDLEVEGGKSKPKPKTKDQPTT